VKKSILRMEKYFDFLKMDIFGKKKCPKKYFKNSLTEKKF
jgi:hypothetical protein